MHTCQSDPTSFETTSLCGDANVTGWRASRMKLNATFCIQPTPPHQRTPRHGASTAAGHHTSPHLAGAKDMSAPLRPLIPNAPCAESRRQSTQIGARHSSYLVARHAEATASGHGWCYLGHEVRVDVAEPTAKTERRSTRRRDGDGGRIRLLDQGRDGREEGEAEHDRAHHFDKVPENPLSPFTTHCPGGNKNPTNRRNSDHDFPI
eukprot:3320794-Rhodomonas_salina.2